MDEIQKIYIALFGRPADPAGLDYFDRQTQGGQDLTAIADLSGTDEYQRRFEGDDDSTVIIEIYQELFGRTPSFAEVQYWVSQMESNFDINDVAIAIAQSAQNEDAAILDAKVAAANQFTAAIEADNEAFAAYRGEQGEAFGRAFLDQIDSSDDVLTDEEVAAQVDTFVETGAAPGEDPNAPTNQVNFTAAVGEQLVGTDENDAFNGVVGTGGTVNVGDTVNGGEGVDTLNLLVAAGGTALPAGFAASNVEVVNVTYAGTAATDVLGALNSASFGSSVEQIWQIDNTTGANGTFQDVTVGSGVTAGFRSTGATATAAVVTNAVTAAAGVTTVDVALDGVASTSTVVLGETTAANVSTVNVSGSVAGAGGGAAGILTLSAALASTDIDNLNLSLTSNVNLALGGNLVDLLTIDASGSTGNIGTATALLDLTANSELTTYTGSTGGDAVGIDIDNAVTRDINVGAGNDVVSLNGAFGGANNTDLDINLGTGADTFIISSATLTNVRDASESAFEASIVEVTGFGADDVLSLVNLGAARDTLTVVEQANITSATSLFAAVGVAAAATDVGDYSTFVYDGSTYVFSNTAGAGFEAGDGLVELVGFAGALTEGSNFFA